MNRNNHRFWLCLIGTIFLAAGVIFLPRHISRSLDLRALNQVEVSKRGDFSFLEQGSNDVMNAVRAFRYLSTGDENLTLLTSIEEPIQVNTELLNEVYIQVMTSMDYGMLPWISDRYLTSETSVVTNENSGEEMEVEESRIWAEAVQSARYYSLTYESAENPNRKELLNFWYLHFSNGRNFDYYFIVNAVNYQIYYAEIHDPNTQRELVEMEAVMRNLNEKSSAATAYSDTLGSRFALGCAGYYQFPAFDFVSQKDLYQKLSIAILYDEEGIPIYIEKSEADRGDQSMYRGICVGFQDLIRWVRTHMGEEE